MQAGGYAITADVSGLTSPAGYKIVKANNGVLTVGQRAITVSADAQSRAYGDPNPPLTYAVGGRGLANTDGFSGSLSTTATGTSNVGSYAITQGDLALSSNYALTYVSANLDVTKRAVTVTANAQSRAYGDPNPPLTYAVGGRGLANTDGFSGSLSTTATGTSNVGSYAITQGDLALSSNYALTYVSANLDVTKRAVTVTANAQSRAYGDPNPPLTYVVGGRGLANRDAFTGGLATTAVATSNVGSYAITQGDLALSTNYALTYAGANLAVTARPLTISTPDMTRPFGAANPPLIWTITSGNLVNRDQLIGELAVDADSKSGPGAYQVRLGTLGNPNYALTLMGGRFTITGAQWSSVSWWRGYEGAFAASHFIGKPFGLWLGSQGLTQQASVDGFRETVLCPPEHLDCIIYTAAGRQYRAWR